MNPDAHKCETKHIRVYPCVSVVEMLVWEVR